jgi:hypothetical protein
MVMSLWLGAGCAQDDEPDLFELGVRLGTPELDGLTILIDRADLELEAIRLHGCGEAPVRRWIEGFGTSARPRQLVPFARRGNKGLSAWNPDVRDQAITLPMGPWCDAELVFAGPLIVIGRVEETGEPFGLAVRVPDLALDDVTSLGISERVQRDDGQRGRLRAVDLTLELSSGPWIAPLADALAAGDPIELTPDDPEHDALAAAMGLVAGGGDGGPALGPSLYRTEDPDLNLTRMEREAGPVAVARVLDTVAAWP